MDLLWLFIIMFNDFYQLIQFTNTYYNHSFNLNFNVFSIDYELPNIQFYKVDIINHNRVDVLIEWFRKVVCHKSDSEEDSSNPFSYA